MRSKRWPHAGVLPKESHSRNEETGRKWKENTLGRRHLLACPCSLPFYYVQT